MDDGKSDQIAAESSVDFVALQPGTKIGRYEVQAVLGQGGFGITYRARDVQLNREVAIKEYLPTSLAVRRDGITVLPRSTKVAEDFTWGRDRFVSEGQTLATLHRAPGIVRVFDFLEINGTAYIVMEMLHGDTLEGRLRKSGRLDAPTTDRILSTLLDGLEQVHDAGFLHRDIKPANILLDEESSPTLIDFGASRAAMAGRTTAMTAIFTPGYAAAEQMTSAKQGPWTDIYGLSATLYHAIVGKAPPNAFERMLDDDYVPVGQLAAPGFPAGLLAGIDAGLAVRASDRPQSIAGWRPLLSMTSAGAPDTTQLLSPRSTDSAATIVGRSPSLQPGGQPTRQPTLQPAAPSPVEPPARMPPPTPQKSRTALYAGIASGVLLLAAGGGYLALSSKVQETPALQSAKVEDLERALAERRAADSAAAEKKRQEEAAQRKVAAEEAAKQAADAELIKAEAARKKAEDELAKLRADIEARRQEAQNETRRLEAEAAQRKAEAEMAALKQAEDDARRKAAAEAEAKRLAEEALARAQAERQQAEAAAKQKAEAEAKEKADATARQIAQAKADEEAKAKADAVAKEKAEADAKAKAEADAKTKAEADAAAADRRSAEAAEGTLRLSQTDRQRIQVALTSLGFDTRGSDGALGPRSRDMIAAWQKARNQPTTGFLTGTQNQALLREAGPALQKYDDEQKKKDEEEKKKAEDAKKKADDEAKARAAAAPAATTAAPTALATAVAPSPATGFDGTYGGGGATGVGNFSATVRVAGATGTGSSNYGRCGTGTLSLRISPAGEVSGSGTSYDNNCGQVPVSISGRISGNQMSLNKIGPRLNIQASLTKGAAAPSISSTAAPAPSQAPVPTASAPTTPAVGPGGLANGTYSGGLNITGGGGNAMLVQAVVVNIAAGRGSGSVTSRNCGTLPINLTVDPSGTVTGTAKFYYLQCTLFDGKVSGRVSGAGLFIEVSGTTTNARGTVTLSRTGD